MEESFAESIETVKSIYEFSDGDLKILEKVDKAAEEVAIPEFDHYLKREINTDAPAIAKKYGILGLPIDKKYGGMGANPMVGVMAGERFGQVGLGFSTFFGAHVMLGEMALQLWGNDEQKEKYLRKAAAGDIIMAYALTEPDIGSDPVSMKTNYEKKGKNFIINGTKYFISNGSIANLVMLMSEKSMKKYGLKPLARIKSMAWAGVDPKVMGKGPVPASKKALERAGLKVDDIDYWEINEAFAVVVLYAIRELGLDPNKVNIHGGAISIGHPLGATGARLVGTLARTLNDENKKFGVATLCVGGGQGFSIVLERV